MDNYIPDNTARRYTAYVISWKYSLGTSRIRGGKSKVANIKKGNYKWIFHTKAVYFLMLSILLSIAIFCTIIYFMPKRLTLMEMYTASWFTMTFVLTVNIYLSFKLHLYGYLTKGVIVWRTLIIHFGVFPAYNAIFLNLFPKTKRTQVLYILEHSIILITYEWITTLTGAFYYNNWNLRYSALLYPFILLILYGNLKIIRALKRREEC